MPRTWRTTRAAVGALAAFGLAGATVTASADAEAEYSTVPVFVVADIMSGEGVPTPVGSSTLIRTDSGVTATIAATGLPTGHVVTLWVVTFNEPEGCETGTPISRCGPVDAEAGLGGVSPGYGGGAIVGVAGTFTYATRLDVGDASQALVGPGLVDPWGAEVALVLKTHGPEIPGFDQLGTFAGGCADQSDAPPGVPPEMLGEPGPNDCEELQATIHAPNG